MPLSSIIPERVRAFAIKAVAKLKPRLTIRRRQAAQNNTSNNIRIRVPLGTVATVLKTTGQIGSSVPGLQMAMEGTAKIVERIEAARNTRKGCKELEAFVQSTIDELYAAKEKMNDEDLDDETWYRLAVLESRLNDIIGVVRAVQNQSRFKRLLNKDRNDAALAREREMLQKGVTVFQVQEGLAMRYSIARLDRDIRRRVPTMESQPLSSSECTGVVYDVNKRASAFFFSVLVFEHDPRP